MPAIEDRGSGSTHLASHVRLFSGSTAGGGVGQLTQVLTPVVNGGYFWRVFGVGLVHDSAATQVCAIYMTPEGSDKSSIARPRIPLLPMIHDHAQATPSDQLFGGTPSGCVVPPGWQVVLEGANIAAGETVYGSVAYLELAIGDHCFI